MASKIVCTDCGSEVVRNNSERGRFWFCAQCKTTRRGEDVESKREECACCDGSFDQSEEATERRERLVKESLEEEGLVGKSDSVGEILLNEFTARASFYNQHPGEMCEDCIRAGCTIDLPGCAYLQDITDPTECDHSFFDRWLRDGIECRWCGYVTTGGPKSHDYGELWGEQRYKRLEEDGFECLRCGISQQNHREEYDTGLHVHHIVPYREFEDDEAAHSLENLATLCIECHRALEPLSPTKQKEALS